MFFATLALTAALYCSAVAFPFFPPTLPRPEPTVSLQSFITVEVLKHCVRCNVSLLFYRYVEHRRARTVRAAISASVTHSLYKEYNTVVNCKHFFSYRRQQQPHQQLVLLHQQADFQLTWLPSCSCKTGRTMNQQRLLTLPQSQLPTWPGPTSLRLSENFSTLTLPIL